MYYGLIVISFIHILWKKLPDHLQGATCCKQTGFVMTWLTHYYFMYSPRHLLSWPPTKRPWSHIPNSLRIHTRGYFAHIWNALWRVSARAIMLFRSLYWKTLIEVSMVTFWGIIYTSGQLMLWLLRRILIDFSDVGHVFTDLIKMLYTDLTVMQEAG